MLTYEECLRIKNQYNNFQFFESVEMIDGYKVSMFNYRLASPSDFANPIPGDDITAYEMRGITFVFDNDGNYKRYIALSKFFNINQTDISLYANIKDKKIINVEEKMDGSFIHFIQLPNKKIIAKTLGATRSEQAITSNVILNNDANLYQIVSDFLDLNIQPCFEYISPYNRIVCKYPVSELVLIKLRCMITGKIIPFDESPVDISSIRKTNIVQKTLDEVCEEALTTENVEGWVIVFDDLIVKQKTKWYFDLHMLLTTEIYREDYVIEKVVNECLDDYLSYIPTTETELLHDISVISEKTISYIKKMYEHTQVLIDDYYVVDNVVEYINKYKKDIARNYALGYIRYKTDPLENIKKDILQHTYHLAKARFFLENGYLNTK